eukprot:25314_1
MGNEASFQNVDPRVLALGDRLESLVDELEEYTIPSDAKCACGKQLKQLRTYNGDIHCMICDRNGEPNNIYWCIGNNPICFDCCNTDKHDHSHHSSPNDTDDMKHAPHGERCDHNISDCPHLQILIQALNEYTKNDNKPQDLHSEMVIQAVNSYHHLMHKHDNDEDFEYIVNLLTKCNIAQCAMFNRNNRDRRTIRETTNCVPAYTQIMDRIHCHFSHSYDVGYRVSIRDRKLMEEANDTKQETHEDECVPITQYLTNKTLVQTKNIPSFKKVSQVNQHKFNQLYPNDKAREADEAVYSFGYSFKYGYKGEDASYDAVLVLPKYCSLKEELVSNGLAKLLIEQYDNEYQKAEIHLRSFVCRQMYHPFTDCLKPDPSYITITHLLSLMIYSNYDYLQNIFSKTYREDGGAKHREFYWLGRYLKLSLHTFGTIISKGKVKRFYHGISDQLVFPQYVGDYGTGITIMCPLSTTSSLPVATRFATQDDNKNGLIAQFNGLEYCSTRYFTVSWLSDFPAEAETLFVQNDGSLYVTNVVDVQLALDYGILLQALKCIHSTTTLTTDIYADFHVYWQDNHSLAKAIIVRQLSKTISKFKSPAPLSDYATKICDMYFESIKSVHFDFVECKQKYSFFSDILFCNKYDWIDMDLTFALFPNIVNITIRNINLCVSTLKDILSAFQTTGLLSVHIEPTKNSELPVVQAIKEYTNAFKDIGVFITADVEPSTVYIEKKDKMVHLHGLIVSVGETYFEDPEHGITNFLDLAIQTQLSNAYVIPQENKSDASGTDEENALARVMMKMKRLTNLVKNEWMQNPDVNVDLRKIKSNPNLGIFAQLYHPEIKWVKLGMLNTLFPNLEEVKVSHLYLSSFIMDDIFKYLSACSTRLVCIKLQLGHGVDGKKSAHARKSNDYFFKFYNQLRTSTGYTGDIDLIDEHDWGSFDVLYEVKKGLNPADEDFDANVYHLDSQIVSFAVLKYKEKFQSIQFHVKKHEDIDDELCIQKHDQYASNFTW